MRCANCGAGGAANLVPALPHRRSLFFTFVYPRTVETVHTLRQFALAQAMITEAAVACALVRCRLAQGAYPQNLNDLSPRYLERVPADVINGQSLHYRRTEDSQFLLYSIGWNVRDDQGAVSINNHGGRTIWSVLDVSEGDWVWPYPRSNPPVTGMMTNASNRLNSQ